MNIQFLHLCKDDALTGEKKVGLSIRRAGLRLCQGMSVFLLRFSRKVIMQNVSFQI